MQSKAKRFGAVKKCIEPVKSQMAEPNDEMHPRLMRADFNLGSSSRDRQFLGTKQVIRLKYRFS